MKENQKTLLNQKINVEDVEKYATIIVKKALKVISCSGSIYAIKLLENKDVDTLKDLQQEVALQLVLDNYTINKNTFKVVRSYIYKNYEKTELEIFTSEENQETAENQASYVSFLSNSNEDAKKASKIDLKKLYSILSETEKKVYYYYFINNMKQKNIAEMLDIKKQNITTYINRIKQKTVECLEG